MNYVLVHRYSDMTDTDGNKHPYTTSPPRAVYLRVDAIYELEEWVYDPTLAERFRPPVTRIMNQFGYAIFVTETPQQILGPDPEKPHVHLSGEEDPLLCYICKRPLMEIATTEKEQNG